MVRLHSPHHTSTPAIEGEVLTKPTIPEVIDRFVAYFRQNPSWGSLHIVLDDDNLEDHSVQFCIQHAEERGDIEGVELARILLRMSRTQRSKLDRLVWQRQESESHVPGSGGAWLWDNRGSGAK